MIKVSKSKVRRDCIENALGLMLSSDFDIVPDYLIDSFVSKCFVNERKTTFRKAVIKTIKGMEKHRLITVFDTGIGQAIGDANDMIDELE